MRVKTISHERLRELAYNENPRSMATRLSYSDMISLVAEVTEYRRLYGPLWKEELELPPKF